MTTRHDAYAEALNRAMVHTREWLASMPDRSVPPRMTTEELLKTINIPLPNESTDAATVVDLLAEHIEPGLMAMPSGRFFGWVIGGTLPAALAADWLTSAWDQNSGMRYATPGTAAIEEVAETWLLDLLGLPADADASFTTGATMANFSGLAAARHHVLAASGWDVEKRGLAGGPRVRVIAGEERHSSIDLALRYLGLGAPTRVASDNQGRILVDALAETLATGSGPTILCLQAGNLHSGAFDPIAEATSLAHDHGAWVHVDGAFGLWAAASPQLKHLVAGLENVDSAATDAHKTLNVPYDCGVSIVTRPQAVRDALSAHASYFVHADGPADPFDKVPEMSRRARGIPVWAALLSLGRNGVADMVDALVANARSLAEKISTIDGAQILNDVVFTQVSVAFGDDERTKAVTAKLLEDGTTWMSGSRWQGRDVLRISVSNWSTDEDDVDVSVEALRRAVAAVS